MSEQVSVQELMMQQLFDEDAAGTNETVEILEFARQNAVPLTEDQIRAGLILKEYGLSDIYDYAVAHRPQVAPFRRFMDVLNALTLANRIKGNAKLSGILRANANPANSAPPPPPKGER